MVLPARTVAQGTPPASSHQLDLNQLGDWMEHIERLGFDGLRVYVEDVADLPAASSVASRSFAAVLLDPTEDNRGIYQEVSGAWVRVAGLPPAFQANTDILLAREEATAAATTATGAAVGASTSEGNAASSERAASAAASTATIARSQTELAAEATGQPIRDTEAAGRALVSDGETHLETFGGVGKKIWRRDDASSSTFLGWLGEPLFDDVISLETSAAAFDAALIVGTRKGRFEYETVADDEDDFDLETLAGGRLRGAGTTLTPSQFGIVFGSGQTASVGQRNVSQLNKMLARAASIGAAVLFPNKKIIEVANATSPVKIPSGITVEGGLCDIRAQDDSGPIVTSAAWADNTNPLGRGCVRNLVVTGTLTDADLAGAGVPDPNDQDGIIIFDYQSTWSSCLARLCRGRGFVGEEENSAGIAPSGTLVENRFENCESRNCAGRGFDLAPNQLGKLSDGFLINTIVAQPLGCEQNAISLLVGAGWKIDGYHTYAGSPSDAVVVARGYNTNIGDGYVETFTRRALFLTEAQQNISVGNVGVRSNRVTHPDAAVVEVQKSSSVDRANVSIRSIQVENNEGAAHAIIRNPFGVTVPVFLGSIQVKGDNENLVTLPTDADTWLSMPAQGVVLGRFTDTRAEHRLAYEGLQLMKGLQHQWSGSGAQSITFSIPYLSYYHTNRKMVCDLTIFSFQNHNMATRATYTAKLCIGGRDGGGAWKAILIPTSAQVGFSVAPEVGSLTVTGTNSGTNPNGVDVTITFTATDSDGYGTASLLLGPTV